MSKPTVSSRTKSLNQYKQQPIQLASAIYVIRVTTNNDVFDITNFNHSLNNDPRVKTLARVIIKKATVVYTLIA